MIYGIKSLILLEHRSLKVKVKYSHIGFSFADDFIVPRPAAFFSFLSLRSLCPNFFSGSRLNKTLLTSLVYGLLPESGAANDD